MRIFPSLLSATALLALTAPLLAQSNIRPGTDVSLGILGSIDEVGRVGSYPNGVQAVAMATTSCNYGTVNVPWRAAMQEDHPLIAFLVAREVDGRLMQISDRSYLKHGFYALSDSQCTPCQNPSAGEFLGVGCSDTYGIGNNGDDYWLGPPSEIDPWLGTWSARCSFFDLGLTGTNCDGNRSFTQSQARSLDDAGHRVRIHDGDLIAPGASFWYQGMYVVKGEPEAVRNNNLVSRGLNASWTGSTFNVSSNGVPQIDGTVLQRWNGAFLSSNTNGGADGRVYIAYRVTATANGYHYEYAVHNRDNAGAIRSIALPTCPGAQFSNFGFHDVDRDSNNDWTLSNQGTQIVISGPNGNALEWNTIYNFWFDCDAAPLSNTPLTLAQDRLNPGAQATFDVSSAAPAGLYNLHLGAGCGSPIMSPGGAIPRGIPGNATFGFDVYLANPGATIVLLTSLFPGTTTLAPGCDFYLSLLPGQDFITYGTAQAGAFGEAFVSVPVPLIGEAEGLVLDFQALEIQPGTGALFGIADLTDGWRIRFGSNISSCP